MRKDCYAPDCYCTYDHLDRPGIPHYCSRCGHRKWNE